MNTEQYLLLAGKRFFMFNMKLYFPEYLGRNLPANEFPYADERFRGYLEMCAFLEKRPIGERMERLFTILDEREVKYLCLGKTPDSNLLLETRSILEEAESTTCMKGGKVIAFPAF